MQNKCHEQDRMKKEKRWTHRLSVPPRFAFLSVHGNRSFHPVQLATYKSTFKNRLENSLIPQSNDSSSTNVPRGRYNPVIETGCYNYGRVEKLLLLWIQSLCLTDFCSRAVWDTAGLPAAVPSITLSPSLAGLQVARADFRKHSWPFGRSRIDKISLRLD